MKTKVIIYAESTTSRRIYSLEKAEPEKFGYYVENKSIALSKVRHYE